VLTWRLFHVRHSGVRIEVEDQVVASLHGLRHSIGSLTRSAEEAVEVPEPSKVIQQVLACLRPDRPPPKPNVHDDSLWPVYKALWKYEVRLAVVGRPIGETGSECMQEADPDRRRWVRRRSGLARRRQ
jgi:hypothetical protein